jgi:hypothetical protein
MRQQLRNQVCQEFRQDRTYLPREWMAHCRSLYKLYRIVLTKEELSRLVGKEFTVERLNSVKDIFVFSCYTDLAYVDVRKLMRSEVIKGIDNNMWIYTNRQTTDTLSRIPVLPVASATIGKYADHPQCENKGLLLPVMSNQKMNAYPFLLVRYPRK